MDVIFRKLDNYGADVGGAMSRFLDDEELYKTCFLVFLENVNFPKLNEAILAMDYEKAFEYAHTLKGVAGNMGLTPLYKVICSVVEALRKKEYANLAEYNVDIIAQVEKLKNM